MELSKDRLQMELSKCRLQMELSKCRLQIELSEYIGEKSSTSPTSVVTVAANLKNKSKNIKNFCKQIQSFKLNLNISNNTPKSRLQIFGTYLFRNLVWNLSRYSKWNIVTGFLGYFVTFLVRNLKYYFL